VDELNYVQIKPKQHIAYCICTKHREKEFSECCLSFDGTIVINASFVKNLRMFFDRTLCMQKQASAITKSCYFQIRNIGRNRSYITEDACKTLVCSLITSCLDYGNALLYRVNTQHNLEATSCSKYSS
jgi:hypothetical protein